MNLFTSAVARVLGTAKLSVASVASISRPLTITRLYSAKLTARSVIDTYQSEAPILYDSPQAAHRRRLIRRRPGLIAIKRGMVPYYEEDGTHYPCTVLEVDRVQVTDIKTKDKHGYYAVQLGIGNRKYSRVTRPMLGHFARSKVAPKSFVCEFQVKNEQGLLPLGTELTADHFVPGQYVDLKSRSKGKGFQGVMKRWGFKGLGASHGVSKAHRSAGSTGQNQDPGRTFPGKKMAGRMGFDYNTIQNALVVKVDAEKGLILIKGPVSGANGRYVRIADAIKKPFPNVPWPLNKSTEVEV
ncbi:mitochondrial 54S ribosomal protein YmL9 [Sugiyamaella lignohabitans]|uniref:Large ribosomal subunit protein uL3m n=1 Tax=Sugiyamaella lignohabitans TaxID=796027 RepID=A0A167FVR4_9ASCO|nr:mitochondrial 54S ribosomal protein YmL9 [Sugiyamaella lignohabitans]ANB15759.1 mitochondrial 54S ribosomal protein YmL9 [Sugiyamaella lignohabitans]